jgi:16S rRNA (adenine1518-N6/adenine1519-N6)-dimethyltransferase
VVEIGAGLGSLSIGLRAAGAQVLAVETDRHLVPVLREIVEPLGAVVVEADAMSCDWNALLAGAPSWQLVANLPYNISTPLVLDVLQSVPSVERLFVMVQREVGERFAASPGDTAYGAVSVRLSYFASASVVGRVPASVFVPRPKVESVLVDIRRRERPTVAPEVATFEEIDELVRAGFATRRKMLRRALQPLVTERVFIASGIAETARAEQLSVEDWGRLAAARRVLGESRPS